MPEIKSVKITGSGEQILVPAVSTKKYRILDWAVFLLNPTDGAIGFFFGPSYSSGYVINSFGATEDSCFWTSQFGLQVQNDTSGVSIFSSVQTILNTVLMLGSFGESLGFFNDTGVSPEAGSFVRYEELS